jgi:hypothetical protein
MSDVRHATCAVVQSLSVMRGIVQPMIDRHAPNSRGGRARPVPLMALAACSTDGLAPREAFDHRKHCVDWMTSNVESTCEKPSPTSD